VSFRSSERALPAHGEMKKLMQSIRELYRIGHGPSSSHTMGPGYAAELFRLRHPKRS